MKPSGKRKRLGRRSVGRNPQRSVSILLLEVCSALLQQGSAVTGTLSGGLIRLVADEPAYLPSSVQHHRGFANGVLQAAVRSGLAPLSGKVFHPKHSEIRQRAGHSVSMGIKISNLFG